MPSEHFPAGVGVTDRLRNDCSNNYMYPPYQMYAGILSALVRTNFVYPYSCMQAATLIMDIESFTCMYYDACIMYVHVWYMAMYVLCIVA